MYRGVRNLQCFCGGSSCVDHFLPQIEKEPNKKEPNKEKSHVTLCEIRRERPNDFPLCITPISSPGPYLFCLKGSIFKQF